MIAHIVLFEPKPGLSKNEREAFLGALRRTVDSVPEVRGARVGRIKSIGQMIDSNDGHLPYSYAAILEFEDKSSLDRYLGHHEHELFRARFWEFCQKTMIVDSELVELASAAADLLV